MVPDFADVVGGEVERLQVDEPFQSTAAAHAHSQGGGENWGWEKRKRNDEIVVQRNSNPMNMKFFSWKSQ